MPKVRPTHSGATGGWALKVATDNRCVGPVILRHTAPAAGSGRGWSNLPARKARMDHGGCPR